MHPKADDSIYPLTFDPVFKDYVWGGRKLAGELGRRLPPGIVAESWEIAGHPNGSSRVNNGALAGLTLPQAQELLGESLLGRRNRYAQELGKFPLLVKLLDANRWLSVQVHPDDDYGLAHEGEFGKTEMWIVLHAEPGAELIYGFKAGVSRAAFTQAVESGDVDRWLHRVPVHVGDVFFLPAGSVHALGSGTIVAEIQQNSDTTYRIYDWGRPRPIHIAQALDVLDFELIEPGPLLPTVLAANGLHREVIGHCRYFQTERLIMPARGSYAGACRGDTFEIWAVLDGSARIVWAGEPVTCAGVGWVLLPAALGEYSVEALAASTLLRVFTPATA